MFVAVDDRGLTLAEVLVATVIIAAGFLAVLTAFPHAMSGIQTGNEESTATFLAQQKLESLRAAAANDPTLTSSTFNNGTTTEPYGTIQNALKHQRVTTISVGPTTTTKRVTVTVAYRPSGGPSAGTNVERTVTAAAVLSTRR
jgi:prepilin-type N-terminal cleavage/methylation domain-containing protein